MFATQRYQKILEIIRLKKSVTVQELSSYLAVSESTIRRDLQELHKQKQLKRTHGGAVVWETARSESPFDKKETEFVEEKLRIARYAVSLIKEGDTICLDGGTTNLQIARSLKDYQNLTLVTNSAKVLVELAGVPGINLIVTGGNLRTLSLALVGPLTKGILEVLHVDKAFIGTMGITVAEGLTTTDILEAETKRLMIEKAQEVMVVADHSKIGKVSFASVAPLSLVDKLITDSGTSSEDIEAIREQGVEVIVV